MLTDPSTPRSVDLVRDGPPPPLINHVGELISDASPEPIRPRRYDLDALRGFAMLLGIVLHAAIPFIPYWQDGDVGGGLLSGIFEFIHGFRMPLFFILSGYFTTMLWRGRGIRSLISHRTTPCWPASAHRSVHSPSRCMVRMGSWLGNLRGGYR